MATKSGTRNKGRETTFELEQGGGKVLAVTGRVDNHETPYIWIGDGTTMFGTLHQKDLYHLRTAIDRALAPGRPELCSREHYTGVECPTRLCSWNV